MSDFVLALDQGTTSSRAIIFDHSGQIVSVAQQEFKQHYPQPGWVEHDAHEIWESQLSTVKLALSDASLSANDIKAIGITNQRETTLVWNRKTGEPIHPAIVWQDRRTAKYIDSLKDRALADTFRSKTGLVLDAYFSGSKVRWLLDNVEGAREQAEAGELAFGTIDSWLVYKLSGGLHLTDVTNASRTLMFNIHDLAWDDELLDILDVPRALLPEVKSSSEIFGETAASILGTSLPIAGIAGDQHAATFGQVCFEAGQGKNTYGTGCFMMLNTGEAVTSKNQLLTTVAWQQSANPIYALEGSIFIGGAVVQWLRDELGMISASEEVESLAASVSDNGGVYLVPAFAGLGAPHWDQYARGTIMGLTRGSNKAHVARAALEAIAYQSAEVVKAMEADSGIALKELRVDGGASNNDLLMQFQADILDVPVVRPKVTETTALGAAYLAGLATGFWSSTDEIASQWVADKRFEPSMASSNRDALLADWHRAVDRAKGWAKD